MVRIAFFSLVFIALGSCRKNLPEVHRAFFHWETDLHLSAGELAYLDTLEVRRLFVRFFDVDWDPDLQDAIPLAEVQIDTQGLKGLEIIPAVFITNRTLENLSEKEMPALAARISGKIKDLSGKFPGVAVREIQIDCDWTAGTRQRYFSLLETLRRELAPEGCLLSATIRLHQWKHLAQTGVPPVDRGMLMCYNTGNLESWEEKNSIFRAETAMPYLQNLKPYPLPLDLALPAFRWGVVFRNGQLVRLIHGLDPGQLQDADRFLQIGPDRFQVEKSTYLEGYYLYRGDRIRLESTGYEEMMAARRLLRSVFRQKDPFTVSIYHLEKSLLQRIPHESMAKVFEPLR